jgi:GMP synthase-like glutamine amidotransferase
MRAHVLQHVPFEDVGSMADWLSGRHAVTTYTRFHASPQLPGLDGIDLVIVMGGPMSVNDTHAHPWLVSEQAFIKEAVERGTAVIGVCLGAQAIAAALGARVFPNACKEIGWFPVEAVPVEGNDALALPVRFDAFHWHGETFDLPPGAVHLARSAACEHQAFQFGRNVIGLQFHLETTPESAGQLIEHCRAELVNEPCIQSEDVMRSTARHVYERTNALMAQVLEYVTSH